MDLDGLPHGLDSGMFGAFGGTTLNTGTLNAGLNLGQRLIAGGDAQSGLPLLREVFAASVDTKRPAASIGILPRIAKWVVPYAQPNVRHYYGVDFNALPGIIGTLTSSGHADEAIRVLITAMGLDPSKSAWLIDATTKAFVAPVDTSILTIDAATWLMKTGQDYLHSGAVDGIALMTAAQRVGHIPLPADDIKSSIDLIPDGTLVATLDSSDAQAITDYAHAVRRAGSLRTAVGIGMLVPSKLGTHLQQSMMAELESSAQTTDVKIIDATRSVAAKGYAAQAVDMLMASDAISPDFAWGTLNGKVVDPSPDVSAPSSTRMFVRAVANTVTSVTPNPAEPPEKTFYFILEGDNVRCDEVKWDAEFDLVFNYDSPTPRSLVEFYGKKFEVLKNSEASLEINILPVGFLRRDRVSAQEITFKDGKMQGDPARFKLKAPARDSDDCSKAGVWISFSANHNAIYKTFQPIKLVDELGTEPCAPRKLDLDLEEIVNGASQPRQAEVFIYGGGGSWQVSWTIGKARKELTSIASLSKGELDAAYTGQDFVQDLTAIASRAIWNQVDQGLCLPKDDDTSAVAQECMKNAMTAGSKLNEILRGEDVFREMLDAIEALSEGARIAFHVENAVFPWELIYPRYYDNGPIENENPKLFWGARFHIESLLIVAEEGEEKVPRGNRQPGKLRLSMGLNKSIDEDDPWKSKPPPGPAARQRLFFDGRYKDRGICLDTRADIDASLLKQADPASILYFYCHGNSTQLVFEKHTAPVNSHSVAVAPPFPYWPIVFINACDAGNISPLSFISFRTKFREKKAAGIIAPSFTIPTMFAAYFGEAVLKGYDERRPIGEIIFELRRKLLDQNNPLGLWYSIQCPLDVVAPEA